MYRIGAGEDRRLPWPLLAVGGGGAGRRRRRRRLGLRGERWGARGAEGRLRHQKMADHLPPDINVTV